MVWIVSSPAMSLGLWVALLCMIMKVFHGDKLHSWVKSQLRMGRVQSPSSLTQLCHTKSDNKQVRIQDHNSWLANNYKLSVCYPAYTAGPLFHHLFLCCFSNVAVFEVGILISEWLHCISHCEIPSYWNTAFYSNRNGFNDINVAVKYYEYHSSIDGESLIFC